MSVTEVKVEFAHGIGDPGATAAVASTTITGSDFTDVRKKAAEWAATLAARSGADRVMVALGRLEAEDLAFATGGDAVLRQYEAQARCRVWDLPVTATVLVDEEEPRG